MKHLVTWHMMQSAIVTVSYYDENSKLWLHWERFLLNVSILCFWRWMLYNPSTDKIDCFKLKVSGFKTRQILWNIDYDQVYTEMSRWQCCRCCMWYKLHCYMLLCYNCNSFCHILHNINAVTVFQCHHHIIIRIGYNCKTKLVYNWISMKTVTVSLWKWVLYHRENERAIHVSMKLHKISYLSRKTKLFSYWCLLQQQKYPYII